MNYMDDINYGLKIIEKGRKKKKGWMALPRKMRRNISLSIMAIIFMGLFFGLIKGATIYRENKLQEKLNSFEYVDVYVKEGETAYELQGKLAPNKDVRELLFYASYKNEGKNLSNIQEGELITLIKE